MRVGFYCWAGPGTIRMTETKFFSPKMDQASFLRSYDLEYLEKIQKIFGVTDMWVTYSWGFSKERESEDREFILSRLTNFQKAGIRTHAYIQGPNVVTKDFSDRDWFCLDDRGKFVSYSRGRRVVCVNNVDYRKYLREKIEEACQHPFDGIFIDNIQMGKLGIPGGEEKSSAFVGCRCAVCREKFFKKCGCDIPKILKPGTPVREMHGQFRVDSISEFLAEMSLVVHAYGKEFGTNSYDPRFDTRYCYGTDLQTVHALQDYILFENHSFPGYKRRSNLSIERAILENGMHKPVFVVSYKKGIGFDEAYSQYDMDTLFSEGEQSLFWVCLKGSEYITKGIWHNLEIDTYVKPTIREFFPTPSKKKKKRSLLTYPGLDFFFRKFGSALFDWYCTSRTARKVLSFLYKRIVVQ